MSRLDVHELADRSQFNRFHAMILAWGVVILVLDGYDLAVVGAALPSIMSDMGVDAAEAGFMASAALFGMMVGAISFGTLADRVGRPRMIAFCVLLFSVFTAAAGLTNDPVTFSVTRFIAGLGIGGVMPIVTAQMAEFAPIKLRARLVTVIFAGYSIGGILVALVGQQLILSYGWESVFLTALLPVLLIPFILKTMPNSISFMVEHGRDDELRRVVKAMSPETAVSTDTRFYVPKEERAQDAPVRRLFQDGRGRSTMMIWIGFFTGLFMTYALSSWLTKLMALAGYSLGSALNFVLVFNIGAMVGAILGGWVGDRFNIKHVLVAYYAVGALSLTLMGYTRSTALLFVVVFVVGASTLGTQLVAYAYASQYYPAVIRSTGVGFASGVGRSGAIIAPIVIGGLVALELPLSQNFMAIGLAGVIGMVAVSFINHNSSAVARESARLDALAEDTEHEDLLIP